MKEPDALPSGTVTFLFTDIEGSTWHWERDRAAMRAAVEWHHAILRKASVARRGALYKIVGDGTQAAFPTAEDALHAALEAQRAFAAESWPSPPGPLAVRMALHAGEAEPRDGDYLADPLNRLSRLLSAGHGGQVLVSHAVQQLSRGGLPAGCTLADLGKHRLRDLLEPEQVFQLVHSDLPSSFPPLKTVDAHPNNLPRQPTPFIGRERELNEVVNLLRLPDMQLLTLTGPGGIGKTRLAVQAAAEVLEQFPDGAFFVDLAPLTDPALLPSAIASALGLREDGIQSLREAIVAYLQNTSCLLVLDNFEHLRQGAVLVAELLASCPQLKVLVTSRSPLEIQAEREFPVAPLALPSKPRTTERLPLETLGKIDSIQIFVERARAVRPDFSLSPENADSVAAICQRLDGLPLAIELAASRSRLLSPDQILKRLDQRLPFLTSGPRDAPARQQTMRAAIDWSYDQLTPTACTLFARVAIFVGGATLEAIETVCADEGGKLPRQEVLSELENLVEHSLLNQTEFGAGSPRIRMLETIREYALERLAKQSETEHMARHHADFFLAQADDAALRLVGSKQADTLDRLESDHDNHRAALSWLLNSDKERALRLAAGLWWFWWVRGYLSEGRDWLEQVLTLEPEESTTTWRARALIGAGTIAESQEDYPTAVTRYEEALFLSRAAGNIQLAAKSLESLGDIALTQGNSDRAASFFSEALDLSRSVGDQLGVAHALFHLGDVAFFEGSYDKAQDLVTEAVPLLRKLGDTRGVAAGLTHLGVLAAMEQLDDRAIDYFLKAEVLWRELNDKQGIARTVSNLGKVKGKCGDVKLAEELLSEALRLFREIQDEHGAATTLVNLGQITIQTGDLDGAEKLLADGLQRIHGANDKEGMTGSLLAFAEIAHGRDQHESLVVLLGAVSGLRRDIKAPMPTSDMEKMEQLLASARAELAESQFEVAWKLGQDMDWDAAVNSALNLETLALSKRGL